MRNNRIETIEAKEKKRKEWIDSLPLFREKVCKEQAQFVFEQATKQLKDSIDTGQIIVARTTTLLTLTTGVLIGLISFVFTKWYESRQINEILLSAMLSAGYIFWICFGISINVLGTGYYTDGSEPKDILIPKFFKNTLDSDKRLLVYYFSEIQEYQKRIDSNKYRNEIRWDSFNRSLFRVRFIPIALILSYLVSALIFRFFCF